MAAIAVAKKYLAVDLLRPLIIGRFPPRDRRAELAARAETPAPAPAQEASL
jgi:hypothetical protein